MQQSKIDIINDISEQSTKLRKLFKAFADRIPSLKKDPEPTINGSNFFTGELPKESNLSSGWSMSMNALGAGDWKYAWQSLGVTPPGELPKNATFSLFIDSTDKDAHVDPTVSSITRLAENKLRTQWAINHEPVAKGEKRRVSYAVVITPKVKHPEAYYTYNRPQA